MFVVYCACVYLVYVSIFCKLYSHVCVCVFGDVSACVSGLVCMYACGGRMLITVTAGQRLC